MPILVNEQETSIQFNRDGEYAYIYTSDSTCMTKLDKKVKEYSEYWTLVKNIKDQKGNVVAKEYKCPKRLISFRNEIGKRTSNANAMEALKEWRESKKRSEGMVGI